MVVLNIRHLQPGMCTWAEYQQEPPCPPHALQLVPIASSHCKLPLHLSQSLSACCPASQAAAYVVQEAIRARQVQELGVTLIIDARDTSMLMLRSLSQEAHAQG